MQKVFQDCYALDERCYEFFGLNEDILMEHAALGMASIIKDRFCDDVSLLIVAGSGNNGADGIVLARLLHPRCRVTLVVPFGAKSPMAKLQLERTKMVGVEPIETISQAGEGVDVVVDALFGAGLNRELDEASCRLIEEMNRLDGFKIACDIPSGINKAGQLSPMAFRADATVTMGALKEALYLDEAKECAGEIVCVDLGIARQHYETSSDTFVLEAGDLRLPSRSKVSSSHKGTFGHAAILCGDKEGAAIMTGLSALRFGAGLVTLVAQKSVQAPYALMQAKHMPENSTAIAVGMGLGDSFERDFLKKHIIESTLPLLLDADSFYSEQLLSVLGQQERPIVLTPHPKEFAAMWEIIAGKRLSISEIQKERFAVAREFSSGFPEVVLLLKGANMVIAHNGKIWINPLGLSKLSKGGSGDILSGLIVSLLAQGYSAKDAAIQGSLALCAAAQNHQGASYGMLPTDLIDEIGKLDEA